ncbi:MAG: RQC domain-containing protein, partial [Bacteroidota bacterium]
ENCEKMCDSCRHPKEKIEVKDEVVIALKAIRELDENYGIKLLIDFIRGKETKEIKDFRFDKRAGYGTGKEKDDTFWSSVLRQCMLNELIYKDIESYGLLKIKQKGHDFIDNPSSFLIPIDHNYEEEMATARLESSNGKTSVLDQQLLDMLRDLRRKEARRKEIPPFIIFQDPSLEDMATMYPITMDEMAKVSGVSIGKARRYARPFIELIAAYVEANDIIRPTEFVVKQVANKSRMKVNIIQGIDRKIPLEDLASSNALSMEDLMEELDAIVTSGTKVNLDYYLEDNVDEYAREDIIDYFMNAETDSIDEAYVELKEDDITVEEIRLMRIKFLSDNAN